MGVEITTKVDTLTNENEKWIVRNHDEEYGFRAVTFFPHGPFERVSHWFDDCEDAKDYAYGATVLNGSLTVVVALVGNMRYTIAEYVPVYHYVNKTEF